MDNPSNMKKIKSLFRSENPEQTLSKRIMLFAIIATTLVVINKLVLSQFGPLPNFEMIIPAICVIGCFSLPAGKGKRRYLTRYFGIVAVIAIGLLDIWGWGFNSIYAFTWSGFLICWLLSMRKKLSIFGRFKSLLYHATLTATVAILVFDVWTCFGTWAFWYPKTLAGLTVAFLAQIPFTLYHLSSLVFIPPLVGLGKLMAKVPLQVPVAIKARTKVGQPIRR
jgi:hypothetical protein